MKSRFHTSKQCFAAFTENSVGVATLHDPETYYSCINLLTSVVYLFYVNIYIYHFSYPLNIIGAYMRAQLAPVYKNFQRF